MTKKILNNKKPIKVKDKGHDYYLESKNKIASYLIENKIDDHMFIILCLDFITCYVNTRGLDKLYK